MALSFQPVTLDADGPDREAALVFRDDLLLVVACRLSDIHEGIGGEWFVEAAFGPTPHPRPISFATLDALGAWLLPEGQQPS